MTWLLCFHVASLWAPPATHGDPRRGPAAVTTTREKDLNETLQQTLCRHVRPGEQFWPDADPSPGLATQ